MLKLILPAIHLFGLIGFIVYKTKTPFFQFMKDRQKDIFEGLNKSAKQAADAASRKKEIELKLSSLESEKSAIASEWKQKEAAHAAALKDSSVRIIAQMRAESEQNKKAMAASLGAETMAGFKKAVLAQAQAKISQSLNAETHQKLNERFLSDVASGMEA